MTPALSFQHVHLAFGRTVALDEFDLEVPPGIVLGLVGRNGAGKTTTLRLALGDLWPDSGRVVTLGFDPARDGLGVRQRVSLFADENHLYGWLTVREMISVTRGLHPRWDDDLARRLAGRLDLPLDTRIDRLSRGQKVRAALVLAVAPRPELLLLDDPTSGLDPLARRQVLEGLIETILAEGHTVVWASHMVEDLERVADRIALVEKGRVIFERDLETLRAEVVSVVAVFPGGVPPSLELPEPLRVRRDGKLLEAIVAAPGERVVPVLRSAGAARVDLHPLSLEEILVAHLGRDVGSVAADSPEEER